MEDFLSFLSSAPTSWHAVSEVSRRLLQAGFSLLKEEEKWALSPGKSYFVIRGGSLCAFSLPKEAIARARIVAAHTDSPALKLKPHPEIQKENMTLFGVEVYGSPLLSSWLNRDLAIAGRIVTTDEKGKVEEKLVFLPEAPLFIPQLAIHLDREVNEKGLLLNKQEQLCPIVGLDQEKGCLEKLLRRQHNFQSLLSFDLLLVPIEPPRLLGELLASYRLDNLASVHAGTNALIQSVKSSDILSMALFWDHEEIGSRTHEGAASPFFSDTLQRIALSCNIGAEDLLRLKARSLCASVDMAHALNPNYPQKHDPQHQPLLGKGIVLKYNADQRYASSALSCAPVLQLMEKLGLKAQSFCCRSDMPCGSTVGPIFSHTTGIPTVDLGAPQLSMHSCREVMACKDHLDMTKLLTHFLGGGA